MIFLLDIIWQDRLIWMGAGAGLMLILWIITSITQKRKRRGSNTLKRKLGGSDKWESIPKKELIAHNQAVKELTSALLLKCSRLLEGDFAEASFIYYLWQSKGGTNDDLKNWEFKKMTEKAQDILKMIFTSFNNLTISNSDIYTEETHEVGKRWERLFLWIRGSEQSIITLDENGLEDFFNITNFVNPQEFSTDKKQSLNIDFKYIKEKEQKGETRGLMIQIAALKKYIDAL